MGASLVLTYVDWEGEGSAVKVPGLTISAANHDAQVALMATLKDKVNAVTECELVNERRVAYDARTSGAARASAKGAQRERKWLVKYEDNTQFFDAPVNAIPNAGYKKQFNVEIGTADFTVTNLPNNGDEADLTETSIAAFVTAFEAIARSPYGGTVNVTQILAVGRST